MPKRLAQALKDRSVRVRLLRVKLAQPTLALRLVEIPQLELLALKTLPSRVWVHYQIPRRQMLTLSKGAAAQASGTPSSADLATAVSNWMADTSMVSNFLNTGAGIMNNVAFKQAATVAYNAEVDELNHKAIIDQANAQMPNVIAANSTLATGGAFQDVVDKLQIMSVQGRAAVANIDLINQNRCVNGMFLTA
jgi:hypothetical protein